MTHDGARLELRSDVRLRHGVWRVAADAATIDQTEKRADLDGQVRISGPQMALEAERAELVFAERQAQVEAHGTRFRLSSGGTGQAGIWRAGRTVCWRFPKPNIPPVHWTTRFGALSRTDPD